MPACMLRIILVLIAVLFLSGHRGGLNREGCHNDRKRGETHCHHGIKSSQSLKSKIKSTHTEPRTKTKNTNSLHGIANVIDGDTIKIGETRIRLHGIDAPESKQVCRYREKKWLCGREATTALSKLIDKKIIHCTKRTKDRYGRIVGVCRTGSTQLNAWMVINGWAVAYRYYSRDYIQDEEVARQNYRGIWKSDFELPWEWRKKFK